MTVQEMDLQVLVETFGNFYSRFKETGRDMCQFLAQAVEGMNEGQRKELKRQICQRYKVAPAVFEVYVRVGYGELPFEVLSSKIPANVAARMDSRIARSLMSEPTRKFTVVNPRSLIPEEKAIKDFTSADYIQLLPKGHGQVADIEKQITMLRSRGSYKEGEIPPASDYSIEEIGGELQLILQTGDGHKISAPIDVIKEVLQPYL